MDVKVVATNKKARFEYFIEDTFEAGLALKGTEIKSIRSGQISLQEAYVRTNGEQAWLVGAHVAPYAHASAVQHDPSRERKLLLHKSEINKLIGETTLKGYTIIPLKVYLKRGKVKVEIGLARGKKLYDKRESLAKKDADRRMQRELKNY